MSTTGQLRFVAVGRAIMYGSRCVAHAVSATMARRIATALNLYRQGPRGY
jgi:hypothetical protein